MDGVVELSDQGYQFALQAFRDRLTVLVQKQAADGSSEVGLAFITSIPEEAPHDDAATFSMTLRGTGALTPIPAP